MKSQKENITPQQANERMKNMAKLANEPEHAFEIEQLRAEQKEKIEKNENDKMKARLNHSMGRNVGLYQQTIQEMDQIYEDRIQKSSDMKFYEAKEIYSKHANSLSSNFSNSKLRNILKEDFDMYKQEVKPRKEKGLDIEK